MTFNGAPVAGAWVQLYDGKGIGTKADGSFTLDQSLVGNYLGEAIFEVDWQVDKSVKVRVTLRVHDGTQTTDSYYEYVQVFTVPAGKSLTKWMYAQDGDKVFARFTLKNQLAPA